MAFGERFNPNGSRVVICEGWHDFAEAVRMGGGSANPSGRIFRGQRNMAWPLASVWERFLLWKSEHGQVVTGGEIAIRDSKLAVFKQYVIGSRDLRAADLTTDLEWWSLGRHFGLVTPLLDWSRSPYVAAFFAFMDQWEATNPDLARWGAAPTNWPAADEQWKPVAIWELELPADLFVPGEFVMVDSRFEHAHRQKAPARTIHDVDARVDLPSRGVLREPQSRIVADGVSDTCWLSEPAKGARRPVDDECSVRHVVPRSRGRCASGQHGGFARSVGCASTLDRASRLSAAAAQ